MPSLSLAPHPLVSTRTLSLCPPCSWLSQFAWCFNNLRATFLLSQAHEDSMCLVLPVNTLVSWSTTSYVYNDCQCYEWVCLHACTLFSYVVICWVNFNNNSYYSYLFTSSSPLLPSPSSVLLYLWQPSLSNSIYRLNMSLPSLVRLGLVRLDYGRLWYIGKLEFGSLAHNIYRTSLHILPPFRLPLFCLMLQLSPLVLPSAVSLDSSHQPCFFLHLPFVASFTYS